MKTTPGYALGGFPLNQHCKVLLTNPKGFFDRAPKHTVPHPNSALADFLFCGKECYKLQMEDNPVWRVLASHEQEGHTFCPSEALKALMAFAPWEQVKAWTRALIDQNRLRIDCGGEIYRTEVHESETRILEAARQQRIRAIVGPAGSGKTTAVRELVARDSALFLTPTGKAAYRLAQSVDAPAATVARALVTGAVRAHRGPVVIDEASMLDIPTFGALLAESPSSEIWMLGDTHQLPSVGPGRVLADLLASERIPVQRLTRVYRQSETSTILQRTKRLIAGRGLDLEPADDFRHLPRQGAAAMHMAADLAVQHDAMVIAPTRAAVERLNGLLQARKNPAGSVVLHGQDGEIRLGDPVLFRRNDYRRGCRNGLLGQAIDAGPGTAMVATDEGVIPVTADDLLTQDDGRPFMQLGYAITGHASQGSQWANVVVVVPHESRTMSQEWLYTALTRASERVWVVGSTDVLQSAAQTHAPRWSKLARRLRAS